MFDLLYVSKHMVNVTSHYAVDSCTGNSGKSGTVIHCKTNWEVPVKNSQG